MLSHQLGSSSVPSFIYLISEGFMLTWRVDFHVSSLKLNKLRRGAIQDFTHSPPVFLVCWANINPILSEFNVRTWMLPYFQLPTPSLMEQILKVHPDQWGVLACNPDTWLAEPGGLDWEFNASLQCMVRSHLRGGRESRCLKTRGTFNEHNLSLTFLCSLDNFISSIKGNFCKE